MEWVNNGMLFVHGGPLELGDQTLRLKCWQRLSHESGDFFTGYHYTASMAFRALGDAGADAHVLRSPAPAYLLPQNPGWNNAAES